MAVIGPARHVAEPTEVSSARLRRRRCPGPPFGRPGFTDVFELGLDAVDGELDLRATRKHQPDTTLPAAQGQQVEHVAAVLKVQAPAFYTANLLENDATIDALMIRLLAALLRRFPEKAVCDEGKPLFVRDVRHIRCGHYGVLQEGGQRSSDRPCPAQEGASAHGSFFRHPLDLGAAARELFFQPLVATIKVVDTVDHGLALGRQPRKDKGG